jgi:hypothetical protein
MKIKIPSFLPLLTILFIGLKLTNHIQWSWLWVLSPLWIGFLLSLLILCVAFALYMIVKLIEK